MQEKNANCLALTQHAMTGGLAETSDIPYELQDHILRMSGVFYRILGEGWDDNSQCVERMK